MSRVNSNGGKVGGGVLCLIIIKCHWAKINGREAERLKDYITKWFPQKKENTHPHTQWGWAIVMSPLDYRQWQITWATQQQPGYLETRILGCANVSPGVQDDDDVGGLLRWKGVRRTRTRTRTAGNCMCGECTCETFTPVEMSMGRWFWQLGDRIGSGHRKSILSWGWAVAKGLFEA